MEKENKKSERALTEEKILDFWKKEEIFQKSLTKDAPNGPTPDGRARNFVFYDGPPFATGLPHYGHILGSTAKDVVGRYATMKGFHVPRRWGWDCHGLPIENIVEKDLGISGHREIEALGKTPEEGIEKFVEHARSKVLTYVHDWKRTVERIGRWVDFDGGYKTMDNTFIESVWWALKELDTKGLLYEGVRVLAYCPRCETPIAKSEIAMDNSYKDITDISVYVKFELVDELGTFLLAWTTTPWSLPGDIVAAINPDAIYVKARIENENYILAKDRVEAVLKDKSYEIIEEFAGSTLVGKKYIPPFDYYTKGKALLENPKSWTVVAAGFVTTDQGTGIAHEAPAFGEDDAELAKAQNIPFIVHVTPEGKFALEVTDFAGMLVKPKGAEKDANQKTDIEIIKYLAKKNLLFAKEKIVHSYPHCYRCETPLFYYALPSWFLNIQKKKEEMLENAKQMAWMPEHLKDGRVKNTMESAPDWNISRNRYWASPLPIWKGVKSGEVKVAGSLDEIKKYSKKSGNKYFVMRHGQAENNVWKEWKNELDQTTNLTEEGKKQVVESISKLNEKIDIIISSPYARAKQTTEIVCDKLGMPLEQVIFDPRIEEWKISNSFSGKSLLKLKEYYDAEYTLNPKEGFADGENFAQVAKRVGDFIYEVESKYQNKNILIVSHGGALRSLNFIAQGFVFSNLPETNDAFANLDNAEIRELDFVPLPHNANYELDLHRPYIDEITLMSESGEEMKRIPEVIDCWFESGSMPFAQDHYPFERPDWQKENFPADFVAEYIAQTRTWFYYTHTLSSILFNKAPFRHVVTTGTLLAEDGQKMSKSKGNFPDPWILFDKYGVDALRLYLMSSPLMKGEDANFSEKTVQDIASKIIGRLDNVVAFYELYRDTALESTEPKSQNVLDVWIIARLNQLIAEVTKSMDAYDMAEATRPIDLFVDDLSTWYLRRSRERIKDGESDAKQTLYFVLKTVAQILAPFAPFVAEDMWQRLKLENEAVSVHLAEWPQVDSRFMIQDSGIEEMQKVRNIVSLGLQARQKLNIPVRQPLAKLKVKSGKLKAEYLELIEEELNVKEIVEDESITNEVELDTNITPTLKREGEYRELVRSVQEARKNAGLTPSDIIKLTLPESAEATVVGFEADMKKVVLASEIVFNAEVITIERQ